MGVFTGSSSASRRPTSAAPLKRRSLGRSRESLSKSSITADKLQAQAPSKPLSSGPAFLAEESAHRSEQQSGSALDSQSTQLSKTQPSQPSTQRLSTSHAHSNSDEQEDPDLADLQSDNTFLYDRQVPIDSALGINLDDSPELDLLERIDAYVVEYCLDCFGITYYKEFVRHDNRLVPFFAKAPRFLSIHSLKRKELERDFTEVADTADTCPREELCLGRCRLGFSCPIPDLSLNRMQTEG